MCATCKCKCAKGKADKACKCPCRTCKAARSSAKTGK